MALTNQLPIYKVAYDLLDSVTDSVRSMPRDFKQSIGGKISAECVEIVVLIFRANCARDKASHLGELIERLQVAELLLRLSRDKRLISTAQYAKAIELTNSIGKVIVEKPERTPAEIRNALADLFERRALGLPAAEDDATTSEVEAAPVAAMESATQGYEVIELEHGPEPAAAIAVPTISVNTPVQTAAPLDEVRFLFGCDGRLQVHLGAMRVICTHEETAAVGRMMSALEPVWNV